MQSESYLRMVQKGNLKAGIPHGGKASARLHDTRFQCALLAKWRQIDLYYSLPILSEYLGHQSLRQPKNMYS